MSAQPAPASARSAPGWLPPLGRWPATALEMLAEEPSLVRAVVAGSRGSAPRETGASLLVGRSGIRGSIGGGRLEWHAIAAARALLGHAAAPAALQRLVLGAELAQCCGGVVELWLERYSAADRALLRDAAQAEAATLLVAELMPSAAGAALRLRRRLRRLPDGASTDAAAPRLRLVRSGAGITLLERIDESHPPVWLYGAGHVGQALARLLAELPLALSWIDCRAGLLPEPPAGVRARIEADPVAGIAAAPAGTRFIVMTHDHALDYALCRAILARGDFAFAGLIGSDSKAARFRSRLLREDGFDATTIARLHCPIGVDGIASKWPAAIAVAVAAQLLKSLPAAPPAARRAVAADRDRSCRDRACGACGGAGR